MEINCTIGGAIRNIERFHIIIAQIFVEKLSENVRALKIGEFPLVIRYKRRHSQQFFFFDRFW